MLEIDQGYTTMHGQPIIRKLPCSEKPSRNSCHESKISNRKLPSEFINLYHPRAPGLVQPFKVGIGRTQPSWCATAI